MREGDYLECLHVDGRVTLKQILKLKPERSWTEVIWLRIGKSGGLL
jgi:hypothetical protein